jgi:uncharacterized protein YgbK (DUF1537 family)
MLEFAVLADDLTGGLIIASLLESSGLRCPLVTSVEALSALPSDIEAVVLARKIRLVAPEIARAEAAAAAEAFGRRSARRIYYKYSALFDSTERGNIGPIAEVLLGATGAARTIFCPAFVERDVTVFEGRMFVRGTPLGESLKRFDPVTPMLNSNLVEVLQAQSTLEVGLLRRRALAAGEAALREGGEAPFLIADAVDEFDIDRLAALTRDWPLTTGADSLAPALVRAWRGDRPAEPGSARRLLPAAPGGAAVLAGSCSGVTLGQIEAFAETRPVWRVDLARDGDDAGLVQRILDWALPHLSAGPVAVATSADRAGVEAAQARFGREGAAARADTILGTVARRLMEQGGVRKFVVAGGETSGAVVSALGVESVQVSAFDEMEGGYCHQAAPIPLSLVLRAGSFGGKDFFHAALARLHEADREGT